MRKARGKKQQQEAKFRARKARQSLKQLLAGVWDATKSGDSWDWGAGTVGRDRGRLLDSLCKKLDHEGVKMLTKDVELVSQKQPLQGFACALTDFEILEDKAKAVQDLLQRVDALSLETRESVMAQAAGSAGESSINEEHGHTATADQASSSIAPAGLESYEEADAKQGGATSPKGSVEAIPAQG
mmetsp:Transcript_9898/g.15476  ORF Transcript_9898/g.15476 Transcript_9898/m.15476 type:complete len:185 (+) Transcript_9898:503-1057(+)